MRHRLVLTATVIALLAAACGGEGTQEPTTPAAPAVTTAAPSATTATPQATTTKAPAPETPANATSEGTGTATVGDTTWAFALSGDVREMCNPDLSGLFLVNMFGEDESGQEVALSIQVPNGGGDAVIQAGSTLIAGELWIADLDVYAASGDIALPEGIGASANVSGNTVSGTATFYEDRALSEARTSGAAYEAGALDGRFEVTCPAA